MDKQQLHVCFVAPLPPQYDGEAHSCGGIVNWTRIIMNYASDRNDLRISVIDTIPRWRSVKKLAIWQRVLSGGAQFLSYIFKLIVLLSRQHVDVIHLTTSGNLGILRDLSVMLIARVFSIPVAYHIHFGRIPNLSKQNNLEWCLLSRAISNSKLTIVLDKATQRTIFECLPKTKVELIPNCINLLSIPNSHSLGTEIKTAIFAGWVVPTKGIKELVEAWSKIEHDGWQLKVVGPGDVFYQQDLINKYQPSGITFLGEMPHIRTMELLADSDLFVFPSHTEGFPFAVLEAMALNKAILASDVGAIPEMLDGGDCGYLIKAQDEQSLENALKVMLKDNILRIKMGTKARERVLKTYSIEIVFDRYMAAWRQAVSQT
jgi:glycosyltransferase involved in cell wall biosynthesis